MPFRGYVKSAFIIELFGSRVEADTSRRKWNISPTGEKVKRHRCRLARPEKGGRGLEPPRRQLYRVPERISEVSPPYIVP